MSADFWAGYISGALGIVVGNPLDLMKVRLQASSDVSSRGPVQATSTAAWTTGTAAPILGYGALNALLFVSYNRTEAVLNEALSVRQSLSVTWLAGAIGGLATWCVSAPTETIKCRAQASTGPSSSSSIARHILRETGLRGFYLGGTVTALRDSIGYGFYFWSYQLATGLWPSGPNDGNFSWRYESPKVLVCGGLAGIATWASVFPLDVIKTRVQTQALRLNPERRTLLPGSDENLLHSQQKKPAGTWEVARQAYYRHGIRVFFRGFTVCCIRAFIVNAIQWTAYETIMRELAPSRV